MKSTRPCLFVFIATVSSVGYADVVTYEVDLAGAGGPLSHVVAVSGTITADTATNALISSDLMLFHEGDAGTTLPALPNVEVGSGYQWSATASELRFVRTSNDTSMVHWLSGPADFGFGSGVGLHSMSYSNGADFDWILLEGASGPDSPGFLVGEVAAVPEASPVILLGAASLLGAALAMGRQVFRARV